MRKSMLLVHVVTLRHTGSILKFFSVTLHSSLRVRFRIQSRRVAVSILNQLTDADQPPKRVYC